MQEVIKEKCGKLKKMKRVLSWVKGKIVEKRIIGSKSLYICVYVD